MVALAGLFACVLAVAATGLTAFGARPWAHATQQLWGSLEAVRIDTCCGQRDGRVQTVSLPTRYDARELEGLPVPVQRCFRAVLQHGQPIITAVTMAEVRREGEIAGGECMRWFAEVAWDPTALLPSQGMRREARWSWPPWEGS